MDEKANINLTVYVTEAIEEELLRQKEIFSEGVLSHHIKKCVEIGLEKFKQDEAAMTYCSDAQEPWD